MADKESAAVLPHTERAVRLIATVGLTCAVMLAAAALALMGGGELAEPAPPPAQIRAA